MIKKKLLKYTVIYQSELEGGFTVAVPTLQGCVTYGKDLKDAEKKAQEAIELYLESLQKHKEPIPTEGKSFPKLNPELLSHFILKIYQKEHFQLS